jgi:hypothetical protein
MSCVRNDLSIRLKPETDPPPDLRKIRRRIEDRLRKDDEAVKAAAFLLKIKQD